MRYTIVLSALALLAILVGLLFHPASPLSLVTLQDSLQIAPEAARRAHFSLILDLRTPQEREEKGFYPNAIPVSLDTITQDVLFLSGQAAPHSRPLLVYSSENDNKAKQAAEKLYASGCNGVRYVKGSYLSLLPPGGNTSSPPS